MVYYILRRVFILRSRNGYVAYGATGMRGTRFHGRLPDSPTFYSVGYAQNWLRNAFNNSTLHMGMALEGHHAGYARCGSGCDERIYCEFTPDASAPAAPATPPRARTFPAEAPDTSDMPAGIASAGIEFECCVPLAKYTAVREFAQVNGPRLEAHDDGSIS